jgi:hypothetical protein
MCVVSLPTFAPRPLRNAWGLHPPSRVGTRNRPALLRVVAPLWPTGTPWVRPAAFGIPPRASAMCADFGHT